MARNTHQQTPTQGAAVRHALDCPGGPLCYCGVTGVPAATLRQALPRPQVVRAAPAPARVVVLPRPLAKV